MPKNMFSFSFFVLLFYSVFLQISLAKNFFEVSFDEICSNQESNNENNDQTYFVNFIVFF